MFFGGGGMNPSFGGGPSASQCLPDICTLADVHPVFTATFGPGGFRTHHVRTNAGQQARQQAEPRSIFIQLLPLFILFAFSLLNAIPSLFGPTEVAQPNFSFTKSPRYGIERHTVDHNIKYHVNAAEFSGHPIAAELARNNQKPGPETRRFERTVEHAYRADLYSQCQRGVDRKERMKNQEVGIFGLGTDWDKVRKIDQEPVESCDELRRLGWLK